MTHIGLPMVVHLLILAYPYARMHISQTAERIFIQFDGLWNCPVL